VTYEGFLTLVGIDQNQMDAIVNTDNVVPFDNDYALAIGPSSIHGVGMFSTENIPAGRYVCPIMVGDKRTPAGRYINHSEAPNVMALFEKNAFSLYAVRELIAGTEMLCDYENNMKLQAGKLEVTL